MNQFLIIAASVMMMKFVRAVDIHELTVPAVVEEGSENVLLDCNFSYNDTEEELLEAFKIFDRDGDQLIKMAEIKHVFGILGETMSDDDIEDMLMLADNDGDGESLNFTEFCNMMTTTPKM